jgi:DNA-directed RNA polymerase subunit RPC12/RpoP
LDFTLLETANQDIGFLNEAFNKITEWIYNESGIEFPRDRIRFDSYSQQREKPSLRGRICYIGPLRPGYEPPRIKLDLTSEEVLVFDPVSRDVHHPYSDKPNSGILIRCYCYEEVFAEKLRALAERLRPRDLYDVIHLYRFNKDRNVPSAILEALEKKCAFKEIPIPTFASLDSRPERLELEGEWENMLGHQLPSLPPFEQFWQELPGMFDWLSHAFKKPVSVLMPMGSAGIAIDEKWNPPAMTTAWHSSVPLERIRFAAANRLCVDLNYQGKRRLIEPYSLRRTRDGHLLLYAIKHETREERSYRIDRIHGANVAKIPFIPKYAIELTPSGPLSAPPVPLRRGPHKKTRTTSAKSIYALSKRAMPFSGPKYVYECSMCGKKFTHRKSDPKLNKHMDKQGYPCPGRTGFYVIPKYS